MARNWEAGGVPASILQDGWWLQQDLAPRSRPGFGFGAGAAGWRAGLLAALVVLADRLFWHHRPGLSLALFAVAVFAAATLPVVRGRLLGPAALLALSVLPVVEHVQPLSLAFLAAGLLAAIGWARLGAVGPVAVLQAAARLARLLPGRGLRDAGALALRLRAQSGGAGVRGRLWRDWAFPAGGALVLVGLLAQANPILGGWLTAAREPGHHGVATLAQVLPALRAAHPGLGIEVTGEAVPLPLAASGLQIVLGHLARNALQHGARTLYLAADPTTLTVSDDGTGISDGNRERIFAPFFTTQRDTGGTGMGLTITENLLRAHGAGIALVPSDRGAKFVITFATER